MSMNCSGEISLSKPEPLLDWRSTDTWRPGRPLVPFLCKESSTTRPNRPSKRRSCDRCYSCKAKCTFKSSSATCTRCEHSGAECTSLRSRLRPGRKPSRGQFGPHGSVHIWEIVHQSSCVDGVQPRDSQNFAFALDSSSDDSNEPLISSSGSEDGGDDSLLELSMVAQAEPNLPRPSQNTCLNASLQHLYLRQTFDTGCFYAINDIFMLAPVFAPSFHAALRYSLDCPSIMLRDTSHAVFTAVVWARHAAVPWDQVDIPKCVVSLQKLRTAQVGSTWEALAITTLGQALAAFDAITACLGCALILRHTLTLIKPWYSSLSTNPHFDPITIAPIFWDHAHSLIRREVPVVKYFIREGQAFVVDRVAGLCTTLLPILYDLCVVSCQLKSCPGSDEKITSLKLVIERLSSWFPALRPEDKVIFSDLELAAMRAQARMYRTAALLLGHRVINPIRTEDDIARSYADNILLELSTFAALAGPDRKLQHVVFPVFMAMLERPNVSRDIWRNISLLNITTVSMTKLSSFVEFFWEKRQCGFQGSIFELVGKDTDFEIVP